MIEDVFNRYVKGTDPFKGKMITLYLQRKSGLGVELNETIANKYTYTGTKLHLEMGEI